MSLIPLLFARLSAAPAPAAATSAPGRYDPGAGHRPLAAIIAVAAPAALMLAVALSPFKLPPPVEPAKRTTIETIDYIPPPKPDAPPRDPVDAKPQVPPRPLPPLPDTPERPADTTEPVDLGPTGPTEGSGSGTGTGSGSGGETIAVESVPAPPLIAAQLDPRYAGSFQPDYPAYEQRNAVEGVVKVRVRVGTDGRVKAVELVSATSPGFFAETRRRALAKWRFVPAKRGDATEESWVLMTVRFKLES